MEYQYLKEPILEFAEGNHVCPRAGIAQYCVYDARNDFRRKNILLGVVGINENIEKFRKWLIKSSKFIPRKPSNQNNLFPDFIGFNKSTGFSSEFILNDSNVKPILNRDIEEIIKITDTNERIKSSVDLYIEKIKFLTQNKTPEVIICIIPEILYKTISSQKINLSKEEQVDDHFLDIEMNFRRMLKARIMGFSNIPIQILRENSLEENPSGEGSTQDDATKAWNLCTALYYKSSNSTIPWKLESNPNKLQTCYVGISFYKSRDKKTIFSSLAQIFDETGHNVILRGTPVNINKDDRKPYLSTGQAYDLLDSALREYRIALNTCPAKLVIHKTSKFSNEEIAGFNEVTEDLKINWVDMVTISDSLIRLLRLGAYPPYRGSMIEMDKNRYLLYTRGSVPFYQTYPGLYIPQPIEIEIYKSESSPIQISQEILALTKMNWNNSQFDRKYPVTIECARNVGKIIKYLAINENPQISYRFYM